MSRRQNSTEDSYQIPEKTPGLGIQTGVNLTHRDKLGGSRLGLRLCLCHHWKETERSMPWLLQDAPGGVICPQDHHLSPPTCSPPRLLQMCYG